jgi:hypothetical protein
MPRAILAMACVAMLLLCGCLSHAAVTLVSSFETPADLAQWDVSDGTAELSAQHATAGQMALHLTWPQGRGILLSKGALPEDWSRYELLKLDAYNPGAPFHMTLRTDDADGATISSWYHYLRTGKTTLEFSVAALGEKVDLKRLKMVHLRIDSPVDHPVEVYFDNLRFTVGEPREVYQPESRPAARPVPERPNLVSNGDFELGLQNWGSWGSWDGGDYSFGTADGDNAYSGQFSAAVFCNRKGRGGIFSRPRALPATGTYTLSFWAKASEPSQIMYGLEGDGITNYQRTPVTTEWQKLEMQTPVEAGKRPGVYLMSIGPGSVYFDEVTLAGEGMPAETATTAADQKPAKVECRGDVLLVNGKPFFAIGIYRASPADLKGTAFNCLPGWDSSDQATLDACAAAGIYMMPDLTGLTRGHLPQQAARCIESLKNHPALLAWYVCDEPDHGSWTVPPDELELARRVLRAADPNHPTCAVIMPWAESNLYAYADCLDILMADPYPIGSKKPTDFSSVTRANDVMRRATKSARPTWSVIQGTAEATPEEETAVVYLSLTHGARGVLFWEYDDAHKNPAVWAQIVKLAEEMRALTPALTSPDAAQPAKASSEAVSVLVKQAPDGLTILAINGSDKPATGVKVTVPGLGTRTGERLFEAAAGLAIKAQEGAISDDFAPYERHVYRFAGRFSGQ